jgi:hypothetical protein
MEALNKALEPISKHLPVPIRDFLNGGGWLVVLGLVGLILLVIIWKLLFRRRPHKAKVEWQKDDIELAKCPMPPGSAKGRRLTVYHVPVRVRLVVVSPVGRDYKVEANGVPQLLDRVVPGLGGIVAADRPSIRVWPAQLSHQAFTNTFHRCTHKPEAENRPSRWVLIAGRAKVGKQPVLIGLGLWADESTTVGRKTLDLDEWIDVVRLEK